MRKEIRVITNSANPIHNDQHRFEHWLIDNQVYFITSRCRNKTKAFATEDAKAIFWNRFECYFREYHFVPWVASLLSNHYHMLGYFEDASNLPKFIQRLHGSVAKLVNDTLESRLVPFWRDARGKEYFDGCIRNEKQARLTYGYTLTQSVRHGIASDYRLYKHTRVYVELERAIARAHDLKAFLERMPYKRYGLRGKPGC